LALVLSLSLAGAASAAPPPGAGQLDISVGDERIIYRGASREPSLLRLEGGDLLLTFHAEPDMHFSRRVAYRSRDGGRTWAPDEPRSHREQAIGANAAGVVLAPDIYTFEKSPGVFSGTLFRSVDGGKNFRGPEETTVRIDRVRTWEYPTPAHAPEFPHGLAKFFTPLPAYYDAVVARSSRRLGFIFWRNLIWEPGASRADGSAVDGPTGGKGRWITAMQGEFHGDGGYRTVLVESQDEGRSWDFVATITADDPGTKTDGYCEPALIRARDRSLVCVMRRGGGLPLGQSRSTDGGKTWSPPRLLEAHGVDPDLCLMSNGVLACTYGRPGRHIIFSPDGSGHAWGYPVDLGARSGSSYMGLVEIAPGRLLVVYDDFPADMPAGLKSTDAEGRYDPAFHKHAFIAAREISVSWTQTP
jgi:hypothetical protein